MGGKKSSLEHENRIFFDIYWILLRGLLLLCQKGKYCVAAALQYDSLWISKARFLSVLRICFDWHTRDSEHPRSLLAVKNQEKPSESAYNLKQLWDSLWMNRDIFLLFIVSLIHWNNFPSTAIIICVSWDFWLLIVACYKRAQRYYAKSKNDRMFSLRGLCVCAKRKTTLDLDSRWVGLFSVVSPYFSKIPEASLSAYLGDIYVTLVTLQLTRSLLRFITIGEQEKCSAAVWHSG